jgi:copper homeostasis protein
MEEARPMSVTFHRAIDVSRDADEALETLIELGVERVLTSGRAATALAGIGVIGRLVQRAAGRISILPGGGVNEDNVRRIVDGTGAREVHVRGTVLRPSPMLYRNPAVTFAGRTPVSDELLEVTDAARIAEIVRQVGEPARAADPGRPS